MQAPASSKVTIVMALAAMLFLTALDVTIISTAAPSIANDFGSSLGYTWVGSTYLLAQAAVTPVWGRLSDIFGRRSVVLTALSVFALGSLLAGVAPSMAVLLTGRAAQGVGAGGVLTLVYVCIADLFPLRDRGVYFGTMGLVWVLASALGPLLGGVFTSFLTWRWCFYVNLPICAAGFVVVLVILRLPHPHTPFWEGLCAIDWIGSATMVGGTVLLLLGLEMGGIASPWNSPTIIGLVLSGVILIALAGLHFKFLWFVKLPLIPLSLLTSRSNCAALAVGFVHGFVLISASFWLPLDFQAVLRATPIQSGVYLLPYALSLSLTSAVAGWAIKRTGSYLWLIIAAMALTVLGFGLLVDLGGPERQHNIVKVVLYQLLAGAGIGPNSQATLIAIQTTVTPGDTAAATSMFMFTRQMATAISIVVGGVIFNNEMQIRSRALGEIYGPKLASLLSGHQAVSSATYIAQLTGDEGVAAREVYSQAMRRMRIVYAACAGAGLLFSFFIRHQRLGQQTEHTEPGTDLAMPGQRGTLTNSGMSSRIDENGKESGVD